MFVERPLTQSNLPLKSGVRMGKGSSFVVRRVSTGRLSMAPNIWSRMLRSRNDARSSKSLRYG